MSGVTPSSVSGPPARIAVLVDDLRANAFDEIVAGDAGERDAIVLLEAFLDAFESGRVAHVAQRHLERGRRHFLHGWRAPRAPLRPSWRRGGRRWFRHRWRRSNRRSTAVPRPSCRRPARSTWRRAGSRTSSAERQSASASGSAASFVGGDMNVGEPAIDRVGRIHALAGQAPYRCRQNPACAPANTKRRHRERIRCRLRASPPPNAR